MLQKETFYNSSIQGFPEVLRLVLVSYQDAHKVYVLINVYAPNKDKDQVNFFNKLLSILQNENLDSVDNIILGGDLNCPLDPLLDKKGGASIKRKSVISCVDDFKSKLDLVDIWRSKNPDAKSFTWSQKSPPVFCRLDYWLISNNLSDFVELTEIIPAVRTDHDAISLELGKLENDIERARKLENELLTVR